MVFMKRSHRTRPSNSDIVLTCLTWCKTIRRMFFRARRIAAFRPGPLSVQSPRVHLQPRGSYIKTALAALALVAVPSAFRLAPTAQSSASQASIPSFEVASVKENKSGAGSRGVSGKSGGLAITDLTVREIVAFAYDVPNPLRFTRIIGGPRWLDADRYDIRARTAGAPSPDLMRTMLMSLLADRFKLATHTANVSVPVYALIAARPDGRLGPNIRRTADIDCAPFFASRKGVPPPLPPDPTDVPICTIRAEPGLIVARARTIADLVTVAFPRVLQDRVVLDRTGLTGSYDLRVVWTPDPKPFALANELPPDLPVPAPPTARGPSIFTAIQEQLGLKLASQRGLVDVRVIDRVERPRED
jgi:uncharacterized protein (TIGR03435 family)